MKTIMQLGHDMEGLEEGSNLNPLSGLDSQVAVLSLVSGASHGGCVCIHSMYTCCVCWLVLLCAFVCARCVSVCSSLCVSGLACA